MNLASCKLNWFVLHHFRHLDPIEAYIFLEEGRQLESNKLISSGIQSVNRCAHPSLIMPLDECSLPVPKPSVSPRPLGCVWGSVSAISTNFPLAVLRCARTPCTRCGDGSTRCEHTLPPNQYFTAARWSGLLQCGWSFDKRVQAICKVR